MEWELMGSAPKDGTKIIVYDYRAKKTHVKFAKYTFFDCYRREKCWMCDHGNYVNPTHWMPLPKSPVMKQLHVHERIKNESSK